MEASVMDGSATQVEDDLGPKSAEDPETGAEPDTEPEGEDEPAPDEPEPEPKAAAQLALFEGHRVSKALLTFSGSIEVSDPEMVKRLKLGKTLELSVVGSIEQRNHGRTKDGLKAVSVLKPSSISLVD